MFIVIPYFNNAHYLKETLKSLVEQTDAGWNVVVLDDSIVAADSTGAIECVRQMHDSRITYQKNPANLGLARNWNQGIELAQQSEFLVILHADDLLLPDYVKEMRALALRYPEATGCFCQTEIIGTRGNSVFSFVDWYKKRLIPKCNEVVLNGLQGSVQLISGNFVFCPTLCYRISKLAKVRFREDLKMVMDFELILRVLFEGGTWVGYNKHPLFQYRRHKTNTTLALTRDLIRFREESGMYLSLAENLEKAGYRKEAIRARKRRVVLLNLGFQMFKSLFTLQVIPLKRETQLFLELLK